MIFNLGHGGEAAGKFILERVLAHQEEAAEQGDAAGANTTSKKSDAVEADAADKGNVAAIDEVTTTIDEDGVSRD